MRKILQIAKNEMNFCKVTLQANISVKVIHVYAMTTSVTSWIPQRGTTRIPRRGARQSSKCVSLNEYN